MKKVYVVVCDSVTCGEQEITLKTFSTKAKAQANMKKCYVAELYDWKFTFEDDDFFEVEKGKDSCSIWEKGRYCQNHISWQIHEKEVL